MNAHCFDASSQLWTSPGPELRRRIRLTTPSQCTGWSVHEALGHMTAPRRSPHSGSSAEMSGVADQRRGLDTSTDAQLVAGHELIAQDADGCGGEADPDVLGGLWGKRLVHAVDTGEHRAGPDNDGDGQTGEIFRAFETVGVALARGAAADPETQKRHIAGGDVGQVVQDVAHKRDGAGQDGDDEFEQAGGGLARSPASRTSRRSTRASPWPRRGARRASARPRLAGLLITSHAG